MIKPWVFEFLPELGSPSVEPDPRDVATLFARYLDLWVRDETLGFEGIFFSEHHFGRSYSPSPNLLIAALAQRTKKLRLGVMGVVLPYYQPTRVVEEIGMLDHITGGRLEIGTAIGVPQELARLNITMAEARERNEEIVSVIDAALADREGDCSDGDCPILRGTGLGVIWHRRYRCHCPGQDHPDGANQGHSTVRDRGRSRNPRPRRAKRQGRGRPD